MLIYSRRERVNSALRNGDRINVALDNVEAMLYSLTGLVNPILMARALRTGTGRYSEVHHQLRTIMRGESSLDAPYSSQLGNHVAFIDEDRLSSSSGDSIFNIEPATQEADPAKSSGSQKAPATSPPPQSDSSAIRSPKHHGDPQKLRTQQQSWQVKRKTVGSKREDQRGIQEKGKVEEGQRKRQEIDNVEEDQQQRQVKDKIEKYQWTAQSLRREVQELERKVQEQGRTTQEEMQKIEDKYNEKEQQRKRKEMEQQREKEEMEHQRKREEKSKIEQEDQQESQEKGQIEPNYQQEIHEIERDNQRDIREPERPSPMIMTGTAAAGVALGGAAAFTADHLSSHGSEDQGRTNSVRRSNDSGYGGSLENDDDGDGCCGCCGDDEDEEHGWCFCWH